jgi:hypothetical protein
VIVTSEWNTDPFRCVCAIESNMGSSSEECVGKIWVSNEYGDDDNKFPSFCFAPKQRLSHCSIVSDAHELYVHVDVEVEIWALQDAVSESALWGSFEIDFSKLERFCMQSVLSESVLPPVEGNSLIVHCVDQLYKYPLRNLGQLTVPTRGGAFGQSDVHISPSFSHLGVDNTSSLKSPDILSSPEKAMYYSPHINTFGRSSSSSQGVVVSSPRRKLRFSSKESSGSKDAVHHPHHVHDSKAVRKDQMSQQDTGREGEMVQSKSSSSLESGNSGSGIGSEHGDEYSLGETKDSSGRTVISKSESFDEQSVSREMGERKKMKKEEEERGSMHFEDSMDDVGANTGDEGSSDGILLAQQNVDDDRPPRDGNGWRGCVISSSDLTMMYNDEMSWSEEKQYLVKEIKKRKRFFYHLLIERSAMTCRREDGPVRDISQVQERVEALRGNVYKARLSVSATKKSVLALRHMVGEEVEELNRKANMLLDASQRYERVLVRKKRHLLTERNDLVRCLEVRRGKMLQMVTKVFHPLSSDHICGMHFDGCPWLFPNTQQHGRGKGKKKKTIKVRDPAQIETIMGHVCHLLKVLSGIYAHKIGFGDKELVLMGSKCFFRANYSDKSFQDDQMMIYQELADTFMIDELALIEAHEMRIILSPGKASTRMDRDQFRRGYMTLVDATSRLVTADMHGTFIESPEIPNPLRMLFSVIRNDLGVHGEDEVEMCLSSPSISVSHRMPSLVPSPSRHVRSLTFALGSELGGGDSGRRRQTHTGDAVMDEEVDERNAAGHYDIPTKGLEEKVKGSSAIMIPRHRATSMSEHWHQHL